MYIESDLGTSILLYAPGTQTLSEQTWFEFIKLKFNIR